MLKKPNTTTSIIKLNKNTLLMSVKVVLKRQTGIFCLNTYTNKIAKFKDFGTAS